jgi:hypothetical protein
MLGAATDNFRRVVRLAPGERWCALDATEESVGPLR